MRRIGWIIGALLVAGLAAYGLRPRPVLVELGKPERRTVREYIAEEAKTRLAREFTIAMPVSGTLERIALEIGDTVREGDVIARVDPFEVEQEIGALEARVAQVRAQMGGVDVAKPKTEDLQSSALRVTEAAAGLEIAAKARAVAEINYTQAHKDYERIAKLHGEGIVSESEFDTARRAAEAAEEGAGQARLAEQNARKGVQLADLAAKRLEGSIDDNEYVRASFQAEIDSLEAQLGVLRSNRAKTEIRAPIAGPVMEKYIDDSRVLPAGTPLMKIGDLNSIEIECDVLSEEVVRVEAGDHVEISGKAIMSSEVNGGVTRVYPSGFMKISALGIEQQRVRVLIGFDPAALRLRPGTRVDVRIITDEQPAALAVPERATFRRHDEWHVFTVEKGRAVLTPVEIGLKNETWAEITNGLAEDALIILDPRNDLQPDTRVAPKSGG